MRLFFFLMITALALCPASESWALRPSSARSHGLEVNADSSSTDNENEIIELNGNVQVIFQNQHLKANKARINLRAKTVDAIGDVLVTSTQANIGGDRVILDYDTNTGVIYNGYVQSGTVLFEGALITKTSDVDYLADNAKYTACTTCPEAWSFTGKKIRAELGGYAYIKSSTLRVAGFPVFWLPYLVVPLKTDRQTGILTPSIAEVDGGMVINESFFWAINRSHDATFTIQDYALRGQKGIIEYNYMLGENSSGALTYGFLRDRFVSDVERFNSFRSDNEKHQSLNRWFLNYTHYYDLPDNFVHRMQISAVSDLQYPLDFSPESLTNPDPALENRMSLSKNTLNRHFSIDASYYTNLLQSNPLAPNDDAVHRLPEIKYSQTLTKIGSTDFIYSVNGEYVNFARNGPGYDDLNQPYSSTTSNDRYMKAACDPDAELTRHWDQDPRCRAIHDGTYDAGTDLIRTGQRLDFQPTLYRPFKVGSFIDVLPQIGYRETQYSFGVGNDSTIARRYMRAEVSAKAAATGIYGDLASPKGYRIKHEIEPELSAVSIPWFEQPQHPFFGTALAGELPSSRQQTLGNKSLNSPYGIQFDYNDRVYDRKLITVGLTNKLTRKTWVENEPQYLQFFSWRLAQSYDLYTEEADLPIKEPLSDVQSDMRLTLPHFTFVQQANYFPYQNVVNTTTVIQGNNDYGDSLALKYLNQYRFQPGQDYNPADGRTEDYTLLLRKFMRYMDFIGTVIYDTSSNPPGGPSKNPRIKLLAYGVELKIPGDCASIAFTEKFESERRSRNAFFYFTWDGQAKSNFINKLSSQAPFGI